MVEQVVVEQVAVEQAAEQVVVQVAPTHFQGRVDIRSPSLPPQQLCWHPRRHEWARLAQASRLENCTWRPEKTSASDERG